MKGTLALSAALASMIVAGAASADTWVNGHVRSDGTYVQPHLRSSPDGTQFNNYSSQGNYNPYTGQAGTVKPYSSPDLGSLGTTKPSTCTNPYMNATWC